jgi:hypothetical protein
LDELLETKASSRRAEVKKFEASRADPLCVQVTKLTV